MIHQITSNLETFKSLEFNKGLNILLADRSPDSSERQTRNSSGKTSLIELIHFLMGGNCDKDSIFRNDALIESDFQIAFDLANAYTVIQRGGTNPSKIKVLKGETEDWPFPPVLERKTRNYIISNTKWREVLGSLMFGLDDFRDDENDIKFGPTFRSLFSYFVRRQNEGGFITPEKQTTMQQLGDVQVAISYILGLDWTISQQWQVVREREKTLKELKKAAGEGALGMVIGTVADLRTQLVVAEERTKRLRDNINNFKVLPQYREFEQEASEITRRVGTLSNENVIDQQLISEMQESLETETAPPIEELKRLYKEAGIVLSEAVIKRFEEVRIFHDTIIENRTSYLAREIQEGQQRIKQRENAKSKLLERKVEIMEILRSHGALDQYRRLQSELNKVEAETEALRQRFLAAELLEGKKAELEIERMKLQFQLHQDFQEQKAAINRAIVAFEEISSALYEKAGSLTIDKTQNGPQFEVRIQGQKSKGISNMQIFCFDMMLMRLCTERGIGPGFLVHDSHIFDGVDDRQIANALFIGAAEANRLGFQYIVTMNSDSVPKQFPEGFAIEDYILPVRLTDELEDGGLFGVRF